MPSIRIGRGGRTSPAGILLSLAHPAKLRHVPLCGGATFYEARGFFLSSSSRSSSSTARRRFFSGAFFGNPFLSARRLSARARSHAPANQSLDSDSLLRLPRKPVRRYSRRCHLFIPVKFQLCALPVAMRACRLSSVTLPVRHCPGPFRGFRASRSGCEASGGTSSGPNSCP